MIRRLTGRVPRSFYVGLLVGVVLGALVTGLVTRNDDPPAALSARGAPAPTAPAPAPRTSVPRPNGSGQPSGDAQRAPSMAPARPVAGPPAALPAATRVSCPSGGVEVSNAEQLTAALAAARPGDHIRLRDGQYLGTFVATASGTEQEPIWLCGGPGAVIDGGGIKAGYGLHLDPARFWRVIGFTIRSAQKGVVADATRGTVIQGLTVKDIGDEGIHLRSFSTGSAVLGNTVRRTGLRRDKFGEGVYVGSAMSNWPNYSGGAPDESDNNLVDGNDISQTGGESVDIKEGTTGGVVSHNTFDGTGMTGADSWVDVKGNNWQIIGNTGRNTPLDGFQTHEILHGWGTGNVFGSNVAVGTVPGLTFHLAPVLDNVVDCSNSNQDGAAITSSTACRG